jgi:large subunit ribosomal protein L31
VKPEIHPAYMPAIFVDGSNEIVTRSTMSSAEKRTVDGVEHNVFNVDISAYTHPFYTGKQRIVDTAGRVERFKQRYAANTGKRAK